ncbi:hypothetical protein GCK72_010818 [Caenorhabditis remanei]|uniref:Uncharacterized protein n=1 Tax=Caenorhabditis remanei TaxID=31234 RepID=A0A6A5H6R8_CAERE|nr:hypothetical protein GCK72_010818 [Caenorhabditis remanei]KAF1762556.1 hypothetical protein GCK72_010818 [Caenorhabditis remanei]
MILFSKVYIITAFIQTIKAFISTDPCDLSIIPFYHKRFLFAIVFLLTLSTSFPFSITIERYYAMKTAEKYEKTPVILGPILVGVNTLVNLGIMYNIFKDESFSDPSVSFSVYPPVAAQKIFTFCFVLFFLNLIDVLFDIILLRQNLRLKKLLTNSSLTAKYQLEEVYQSTKFSVFLILIHIISFGIYVSAVAFFRYFGSLIISDPYYVFGMRLMCSTMIPTYHLLLGVFSILFLNRIKSKKSEGTTIQMSSTGRSGANNYDHAIFSIWNSVSGNPTS